MHLNPTKSASMYAQKHQTIRRVFFEVSIHETAQQRSTFRF